MGKARTRTRYHHGDLRRTLVEIALARVTGDGEAAVSLRSVAKEAGVSAMAVYRHFADLDALLSVVATRGFEQLALHLETALNRPKSKASKVEVLGLAYLDFAARYPGIYNLIFARPRFGTAHDDELAATGRRAFGILVDAVRESLPAKRKDKAKDLANVLWAALHGAATLTASGLMPAGEGRDPKKREKIGRFIAQSLNELIAEKAEV